jgi:hypothetical protein
MSIDCDVVFQWDATAEDLTALGTALWRWCNSAPGILGIYRSLDNQPLADLIAGKFPASSKGGGQGVHLRLRDEGSHNRQATIASLRKAIPVKAVADIVVDGASWNLAEAEIRKHAAL